MRILAFMVCLFFAASAYAQKAVNSSFIPLTPADIAALQAKAAQGSQSAKDILAQYNTHEEKQAATQQQRADSLSALKEKAAAGDAASENALGEAYSNGRGMLQSYAEARKWYAKAAAQGDKDAIHNLKRMRRQEYLDHRAKVIADRRQALEDQQEAARERAAEAREAAAQQAAAAQRQIDNAKNSAAAQPPQDMTAASGIPQAPPTPVLQSWIGIPTAQSVAQRGVTMTPAQAAQLNMQMQFAASKGH